MSWEQLSLSAMWHGGDVTWPTCKTVTVGSNQEPCLDKKSQINKRKNNITRPSPICLKCLSNRAKSEQSRVFTQCDLSRFKCLIRFAADRIAANEPNLKQLHSKQPKAGFTPAPVEVKEVK